MAPHQTPAVRLSGEETGGPPERSGDSPDAQGEKPGPSDGDDLPDKERDAIDDVAFRNGDDKCFRAVLDRFESVIRGVLSSYGDCDADRQDLYQEVCIRMLEQREKYRERDSMGGWIRTLARHVARNWRDSRIAHESAQDEYVAAFAPIAAARHITEDPSRLLIRKELMANVEQALDTISDQQANALRLVHIEGYSVKEAAQLLDTKPATVRSNVRHAREKLREQAELRDEMS